MSSSIFCVGLTGGIGSGKSAAAQRFAELGGAVIDTDVIARALTASGGKAMTEIVAAFGPDLVCQDGALDRAAMRARVFSDATARQRLEAILHPLIRAESIRQLEACVAPYAILVVPLLVEHLDAYRALLDRICVVDCDPRQQLERTAARPGLDLAQAEAILAVQVDAQQRLRLADDVIDNRAGFSHLDIQVRRLHDTYSALAERKHAK
jgi:dephospho-CoA kinase